MERLSRIPKRNLTAWDSRLILKSVEVLFMSGVSRFNGEVALTRAAIRSTCSILAVTQQNFS